MQVTEKVSSFGAHDLGLPVCVLFEVDPIGFLSFLAGVDPDFSSTYSDCMPWQRRRCWAGIYFPQGAEFAAMARAEKALINSVYKAAQVRAFQA
jgi:hypothetical protein